MIILKRVACFLLIVYLASWLSLAGFAQQVFDGLKVVAQSESFQKDIDSQLCMARCTVRFSAVDIPSGFKVNIANDQPAVFFDFGDNSKKVVGLQQAEHTFTRPGRFTVTFEAQLIDSTGLLKIYRGTTVILIPDPSRGEGGLWAYGINFADPTVWATVGAGIIGVITAICNVVNCGSKTKKS